MKDYYQILGVTPTSGEEEIRKNYRRLAMQYHPDHNGGSAESEAKFKEIAEAYGVLTDPVKRRQYDAARAGGGPYGQAGDFSYSQEDILRDLFQDPRFQQMFQQVLGEFARRGFRANPQFIRQSFFGGKGGMIFGGLFFLGSLAGPAILSGGRKKLGGGQGVLKTLGGAVGRLLGGGQRRPEPRPEPTAPAATDTTYTTYLSAKELAAGKTIVVVTEGPEGKEKLKVKIPPGSKAGQKLKLRGKGLAGPGGRGDLLLHLLVQDSP